jgi:hypothetical protein
MSDWISQIVMAPGADGDRGGEWTLTVTRAATDDEAWWGLALDARVSRDGLRAYRSHTDADYSLVTLSSDLPFAKAARDFGLDPAVFGSPTIWPVMHREGLLEMGIDDDSESGWAWVHTDMLIGFPFQD